MYGANAIAKTRSASEGFLVHSLWYTIQGEGPWAGYPTIFLRLAGCNLRCSFCFVGLTYVTMGDGNKKRIKDVKVGDIVLAYNEADGRFAPKLVTKVMSRPTTELVSVKTGKGTNPTDIVTCTPDHPFLVRDKGWVAAENLESDDVLVHFGTSEKMRMFNPMKDPDTRERATETSRARGYYDNGGQLGKLWKNGDASLRDIVVTRMSKNNPMKDPAVAAKGFLARKDRGKMSGLEARFLQSVGHLPVKFVGDGSLPLNNKFPDFVVEGQKKVIEIWPADHDLLAYRDAEWQAARSAHFAAEGYKTLFLPIFPSKKSMEESVRKTAEFIHNGEVVQNVFNIEKGSRAWTRHAGTAKADAIVYNLEVEDWHTYIANGKVVHNCDTEFTTGAQEYNLEKLFDHIMEYSTEHSCNKIVITGGEPMLQPLTQLIQRLLFAKINVQIETAGTAWPDQFEYVIDDVLVVCSPKTKKLHPKIAANIYQIVLKYIIEAASINYEDGLPKDVYRRPKNPRMFPDIYVQPCEAVNEEISKLNLIAALVSAMSWGYRLSIQLHKIVGVP